MHPTNADPHHATPPVEPDFAGDLLAAVRAPAEVFFHAASGRFAARAPAGEAGWELIARVPPLYPEWLGDRSFGETHGARFAYVGGEMARGIATVEMVLALARAGGLGFFGAAGLPVREVEAAVTRLAGELDPAGLPWGVNLIHSPDEPALEEALVDLFLARGVRRVSASAFMKLSPAVVRYAASGLHREASGVVRRRFHLFAKVSRPEVARQFLAPAPEKILAALVAAGRLTAEEAALARTVPLADDVTVEADSGGHTDNRPLGAIFPVIAAQRDACVREFGYAWSPRLGAAGGLGTPAAVAAAFALGAAYVVIGSVNQSCVESGIAPDAREMLAAAEVADVAMTAAGDMFEQGVKVQVLKRGSLMAMRGNTLYSLYRQYGSIEALPPAVRTELETQVFRGSLDAIWGEARAYLEANGRAAEADAAERDPRAKFARLSKWYLGRSSRWPIDGEADRRADYQLWCGPAMGAFNVWVKGTFLEPAAARTVAQVMLNLLEGATIITRAHQLRTCGVPVPATAFAYKPEPLAP